MNSATSSSLFHGVMKLKTLCVGGQFAQSDPDNAVTPAQFPGNVLRHAGDFAFFTAVAYDQARDIAARDQDIDLVFLDADLDPLSEISLFITQLKEIRPKLPVVLFTSNADDSMRYLMREGATWHFIKDSRAIETLAEQIHRHVFSAVNWAETFAQYASDSVKPRIEPGLGFEDLEALQQNPEERYIIKRLFANSELVQIFRMDEGFSGSRIYTVKPAHQLKRILKIEVADQMESVQEKQERLIQPRLNHQVGQLQGKTIRGQHLAGACYTLAGSSRDAITLSQFLQDQNRVRKDLIDRILEQLQDSLEKLYAGSSDTELRYWSPLYSRVLPTQLVLEDAILVEDDRDDAEFVFANDQLTTLSSVPGNRTLQAVNDAIRHGRSPEIILRGFEVAELDTKQGVLYLHDDLMARYPVSNLMGGKNHPILRFKVRLNASDHDKLTHPVFRRGKRVSVRGRVCDTQETILARNIAEVTGQPYDFDSQWFEFVSGRFIAPTVNIRHLLWEIGREDMIVPIPQISPVLHGDLNTSNILVESGDDVPVWLIDFSDARPGHVYFDLAKLEVEFRTHVLYKLFKAMVDDGIWSDDTASKFLLLIEDLLLQKADGTFEDFIGSLRDFQTDWFDSLYMQFPLYSENLLYFLFQLRKIAESYSPERFKYHYPVAVFFQSIAALKYEGLNHEPWHPWSKRLALACALVSGKHAMDEVRRPSEVSEVVEDLRQRSAFAMITVGSGEERKYLLQWNTNWEMFNLVGGKISNEQGDRDSFARAIQRKLAEELGLRSPKDYRIVKELRPVLKQQFSRREHVFKEYEFRLFHIEFLPRHPGTREEYERFAHRLSPERENVLISRAEIERLRTLDNRPISETTRMILQELGEIDAVEMRDMFASLDIQPDTNQLVVSRGRAQLNARLINPRFGSLAENVSLEVLPSPNYEVAQESGSLALADLDAGQEQPFTIWLQPKEKQASISMRVTYYDARGNEYRQQFDCPVTFDADAHAMFHIDNPYVVGKPLTAASQALYVGRDDVFGWIEENLLGKTQPHTLILYGQRRMGKTSTLYQLVDGLRGRTVREYPGRPIFPVYIDLQRVASCDTGQLFAYLGQQITRYLQKRDITLQLPETWPASNQSYDTFDAFLDQAEAVMPENGLLVLIMDEFEQLQESVERGLLGHDVLPYLRSLMQHRSRLAFILAGTNQLVEDYWSIIFHVGLSHEITTLTRAETERLIREPVLPMIQYDDLAVDQIWLATRGHPYFTQLICHRLISAANLSGSRSKLFTLQHVRDIIESVVGHDDSHLRHLWNESTRDEQFVLAALAGSEHTGADSISRSEISARLRGSGIAEEAIGSALKQLELRSLVARWPIERQIQTRLPRPGGWQPTLVSKDYAYTVAFDLLRRWVLGKRPLGSLLPAGEPFVPAAHLDNVIAA